MARQLTETAQSMIIAHLQANIASALSDIYTLRGDNLTTMETPSTQSYFTYPKAHGYKCPAIFVIDKGMDFRQTDTKANHINAMLRMDVAVKVEDKEQSVLVTKCLRYQAALHELLEQTNIVSSDNKVKINIIVRTAEPSEMYTLAETDTNDTASFFKEYRLSLEINYFENF